MVIEEGVHQISSRVDTSEGDIKRKLFSPSPFKFTGLPHVDGLREVGPTLALNRSEPTQVVKLIGSSSKGASPPTNQVAHKANFESPYHQKIEDP